MITAKTAVSELNGLQPNTDSGQLFLNALLSASNVAVWRIMFFIMAVAIWTVENLFDEHKAWINAKAIDIKAGTEQWYQKVALLYQAGDPLVFTNGVYQYSVINPANRIVKLAAVNSVAGQILLKVAKTDGSDNPTPLTVDELDAFNAYMQKMKFAGFILNCVSRPADQLRIQYRVYVDPLVINSTGGLISNPSIKPVEDVINNYCKNLPYDGTFSTTALTDLIQQVPGVLDPIFENAQAQFGAGSFFGIGDYYVPNGGYLRVDPLFPLSNSIVYL